MQNIPLWTSCQAQISSDLGTFQISDSGNRYIEPLSANEENKNKKSTVTSRASHRERATGTCTWSGTTELLGPAPLVTIHSCSTLGEVQAEWGAQRSDGPIFVELRHPMA